MIALVLCSLVVAAQGDKPRNPSPRQALERLEARLLREKLPLGARERLLRDFLTRNARTLAGVDRRKLELRLAVLALARRRPRAALRGFEAVARAARSDELDLRARASLGVAQAHELLGDETRARRGYEAVLRAFTGTRYARLARQASARLGRRSITVGARVPLPDELPATDGKVVALRGSGVRWTLVVILRPSRTRLPGSLRWLEHTRTAARLVVFAAPKAVIERARIIDAKHARSLHLGAMPIWFLLDDTGRIVDVEPSRARLLDYWK